MSLIINSGPKPEDSLPIVDEKAIVHKTSDATANVTIDAEAVSTATTRTITMPDKDIDLGDLVVIVKEVTDSTIDPSAGALEVIDTAVALLGTPHAGWDGALEGDIVTFSGSDWEVTEAAGSVEFLFSLGDKGLYGYDATNKWESKVNILDEWENVGGVLRPKSGFGANGTRVGTEVYNYTTDNAEGVFSNATGLSFVTDHYEESDIDPDGVTNTGTVPFNAANYNNDGGGIYAVTASTIGENANRAFNGVLDTNGWLSSSEFTAGEYNGVDVSGGAWIAIDTGGKVINRFRLQCRAGFDATDYRLEGSADGSNWTSLTSLVGQNTSGTYSNYHGFSNATSYIHYRLVITKKNGADSRIGLQELQLIEADAPVFVGDRTIEATITATDPVTFSPANLQINLDTFDIDNPGDFNIDYKVDAGSYTGVPITTAAFRTLSPSLFGGATILTLKLFSLNAQDFDEVAISTVSAEVLLTNDGNVVTKVNGIVQHDLSLKADLSEVNTLDEWEDVSGVLRPKSGFGANGTRIGTEVTEYTTNNAEGVFSNNTGIIFVTDHYEEGSDPDGANNTSTTDSIIDLTSNTSDSGNVTISALAEYSSASTAFDADTASSHWHSNGGFSGGTGVTWIQAAFTSPKIINKYRVKGHPSNATYLPKDWTIQGRIGVNSWVDLHTVVGDTTALGDHTPFLTFVNSVAYDDYRMRITATGGATAVAITNLEFIESIPADPKTIEATITATSAVTFAPATLLINLATFDIDTPGDFNIDYKIDAGAYTGVPITTAAFRALSPSLFAGATTLTLKLFSLNAQDFDEVFISTASAEVLLTNDGNVVTKVNGVVQHDLSLKADLTDVNALDEWEMVGSTIKPKSSSGATEVEIATPSNEYTATGDDDTGNYSGTGADLEFVTDHWENKLLWDHTSTVDVTPNQTDANTPNTVTGYVYSGGNVENPWEAFDGDINTTTDSSTAQIPVGEFIKYEFPTPKLIGQMRFRYGSDTWNSYNFEVHASNDDATWEHLGNVTQVMLDNTWTDWIQFEPTQAYKYYRFTMNVTWHSFKEIELAEATAYYPVTNNTVIGTITYPSISAFAPGSVIIEDENSSEILGTGKINLAYEIDGGGFSSLIDLQDFKILPASLFASATTLDIKIQAVGSQKFSTIKISTTSAGVRISENGVVEILLNGIIVHSLSDKVDLSLLETLDEWEMDGSTLKPKESTGSNEVEISTPSSQYQATGDVATGDFENAGVNVNFVTDHWTNGFLPSANPINFNNYQTSNSSPYTVTSDSAVASIAWNAFQGTTNEDAFYVDKSGANVIDIDFGTPFIPVQWGFYGHNSSTNFSPVSGTIQGWNGDSWDTLDAQTGLTPLTNSLYGPYPISSSTAYQLYRCTNLANNGVGGVTSIAEILIYDGVIATTDNTVDGLLDNVGVKNFAPGDVIIEDENSAEIIGTGKINLAYSIDGGAFSSLIDLQDFKILSATLFDSVTFLRIRVQAVGSQKFSTIRISTTSAGVIIDENGLVEIKLNGIVIHNLTTKADQSVVDANKALVASYRPPLADTATLIALTEASLVDNDRRFVKAEGRDFFYDSSASTGDLAPTDQTGGTGFWIREQGLEIITSQLDTIALDTNFPAASNNLKWSLVQGVSPQDEDGFYQSNGTDWIKRLDDSDFKIGTRSDLFDYDESNIAYLATDELLSGTLIGTFGNDASAFDTNDLTQTLVGGTGDYVGKLHALDVYNKFIVKGVTYQNAPFTKLQVQGLTVDGGEATPANWANISVENLVDNSDTAWTVTDGGLTFTNTGATGAWGNPDLEFTTSSPTQYYGHRLVVVQAYNATSSTYIETFSAFKLNGTPSANTNTVNSINKLHSIVKDFGEWVVDPDTAGTSLYDYSDLAIVKFGANLYQNTSGGIVAAGTTDPTVNTTDWGLFMGEQVLTLALTGSNINLADATGYSASVKKTFLYLTGTLSENITVTLPAGIDGHEVTIIDDDGNGLTSPDYTILIIPTGVENITSSDGILVNQYDLDQDAESATFKYRTASTKWGAI
jgi:hypothetical protein